MKHRSSRGVGLRAGLFAAVFLFPAVAFAAMQDRVNDETAVSASGGITSNAGLDVGGGSLTITDSNVSATGTSSEGLLTGNLATLVVVERSTILGTSNSVLTANAVTANFGASRLDGTVSNPGAATLVCVASYNGSFVALLTTCN